MESAYSDLALMLGAFAHWNLDETSGTTANERVGSTNGVYVGSVALNDTPIIGGEFGKGISLNGINAYMNTQLEGTIELLNDFTVVTLFVVPNLIGTGHIMSKNDASGSVPHQFALASGNLREFMSETSTPSHDAADSSDAIVANVKCHVAVAYDDSAQQVRFYIDGNPDSGNPQTMNLTASRTGSTVTAKIGARGDGAAAFFEGVVQGFTIYKRVLTEHEIRGLQYRSGARARCRSRSRRAA